MEASQVTQMLDSGVRPVVTFNKQIEDQEGYIEAGMRGRLVGHSRESDGMVVFHVDLQEFDEFNKAFESRNYYDKNHEPCLTAREAGFYKPQDKVWVSQDGEIECFTVEPSTRTKLHEEFVASGSDGTYVQWLEDRLNAARFSAAVWQAA